MLKVARDLKPKHINILGDFGDLYTPSAHRKDPRMDRRLKFEIDGINTCLDELDALKAKYKRYVSGNHENRLERFLIDKAPELFDFVKIEELLDLDSRGWEYTPYRQSTKIGKIHMTHDVGTAGANAHVDALNAFQDNAIIGHTHRMAYAIKGNAKGEAHVAAMFGWLGDVKKVDYMHRVKANRDWALGFGFGYLDTATQITYVTPVPIVKYTCVVNGKLYKG